MKLDMPIKQQRLYQLLGLAAGFGGSNEGEFQVRLARSEVCDGRDEMLGALERLVCAGGGN